MNARISTIIAWGSLLIATVSILAVIILSLGTLPLDLALLTDPINGWITGLIGALIVTKRHQNPIGWVLLLLSLSLTVSSFAETYALFAVPHGLNNVPGALLALWAAQILWGGIFIGLTLLLHLFPTGKPLDRFWRVVMRVSVAAQVGLMILFAVNSPMSIENADQTVVEVANPIGLVTIQDEGSVRRSFLCGPDCPHCRGAGVHGAAVCARPGRGAPTD